MINITKLLKAADINLAVMSPQEIIETLELVDTVLALDKITRDYLTSAYSGIVKKAQACEYILCDRGLRAPFHIENNPNPMYGVTTKGVKAIRIIKAIPKAEFGCDSVIQTMSADELDAINEQHKKRIATDNTPLGQDWPIISDKEREEFNKRLTEKMRTRLDEVCGVPNMARGKEAFERVTVDQSHLPGPVMVVGGYIKANTQGY